MSANDEQKHKLQTVEGLGGSEVQEMSDPRTKKGFPDVSEPKTSDPERVHRSQHPPEKYLPNTAQGVGYDPASATVATLKGAGDRSSGESQTGTLPQCHDLGGRGGADALGAVGADTHAPGTEKHAKSIKERVRAWTAGGEEGKDLHRGFDITPPSLRGGGGGGRQK